MSQQITWIMRGLAGLLASVSAFYAIWFGVIALDIVTRPINQGWIELLLLLLSPIFLGVFILAIVSIVLGRFAWRGRIF